MTRRTLFGAALAATVLPAAAPAGTLSRETPPYITVTVSCASEAQAQDIIDTLANKLRSSVMPSPEATSERSEVITLRSINGIDRVYQKTLSVQGEVRLSTDR